MREDGTNHRADDAGNHQRPVVLLPGQRHHRHKADHGDQEIEGQHANHVRGGRMLEEMMRERGEHVSRHERANAEKHLQGKRCLEAVSVDSGPADRRGSHADVAEVAQEADDNAGKSNDSVVGRAEVPGHDRACDRYTDESRSLGQARVNDIPERLRLGDGHEGLAKMRRGLRGALRSHRSICGVRLDGFEGRMSFAEINRCQRSERKRSAHTFDRASSRTTLNLLYFNTQAAGVAVVSRPVRQLRSQR